jgi:nucleoside-diphosphate-sugar epimerase
VRVFVTGASGWIGSAVVPELLAAGHEVVALARTGAAATALASAGAEVRRGDLDDLVVLHAAAVDSDGVIHLAYRHDLSLAGNFEGAAYADRRAIETFGEALAGTGRPLLIASGTAGVASRGLATENDGHCAGDSRAGGPAARLANAELALSFALRGIRSAVVRLAPTVHGEGDNGFMRILVGTARERAVSAFVGDGANRWPAVHRLDAARLFRLALEQAPAGSTLHAVGDEGVRIRDIAEVIARHLDVPVSGLGPAEAAEHFGFLAHLLAADAPASSTLTRERMGWQPTHPGLIDDLDQGHYFADQPRAGSSRRAA